MRTKEEVELWKQKCPIRQYESYLLEKNITQTVLDAIKAETLQEIEDAILFAETSPYPPLDEMYKNVYCEGE